jgi:hypothetical protein
MRMIEQLAQVLARVVFHKNLYDYPKALDEIRLGGKNLVGIDWTAFVGLNDKDMIDIIRVPASDDARLYTLAADLLVAEADIRSLQENDDLAWMRNVCAFSLYCETLKVIPSTEIEQKAEGVLRLIEGFELPAWIEEKRIAFRNKTLLATTSLQTGYSFVLPQHHDSPK